MIIQITVFYYYHRQAHLSAMPDHSVVIVPAVSDTYLYAFGSKTVVHPLLHYTFGQPSSRCVTVPESGCKYLAAVKQM